MILHIISKSPFSHSALSDAIPLINDNDSVILIDDGVYAAADNSQYSSELALDKANWHALDCDIQTRGLTTSRIKTVTMKDFVNLTIKADKTISWY